MNGVNGMALIGILLIVYAIAVVLLTVKKPESIWKIKKIQMFEKMLGVKGTEIFFYVFAVAAAALGVWLLMR